VCVSRDACIASMEVALGHLSSVFAVSHFNKVGRRQIYNLKSPFFYFSLSLPRKRKSRFRVAVGHHFRDEEEETLITGSRCRSDPFSDLYGCIFLVYGAVWIPSSLSYSSLDRLSCIPSAACHRTESSWLRTVCPRSSVSALEALFARGWISFDCEVESSQKCDSEATSSSRG
jgi:hypothetical protein